MHHDDVGDWPDPSEVIVECEEKRCEAETTAEKLTNDWQATNDLDEVILCPDCAARVLDKQRTPTEMRRENNQKITEFTP